MTNDTAKQMKRTGKINARLKCLQINLQHSRLAIDRFLKITQGEGIDVLCKQETYTIGNTLAGISKSLIVYTSGARSKWAAL